MTALVRAELRERWRMLAGVTIGVVFFTALMAGTFQSLGVGMLGSAFSSRTPKAISALSGTSGANLLSPDGWLGFGFAHPMFLLLGCTVAIAIPAASIAGTVESGRADLLFSRPQRRSAILGAWITVWFMAQLTVAGAAVLGTLGGSLLDSEVAAIGAGPIVGAVLQSATLFTFIAGVAFLASSVSSTRSGAVGLAVAAVAGLYMVNFCSSVIGGLGWLKHLSPFGYYEPVLTLTGGFDAGDGAVLVAGGIVLAAAAAVVLKRRDLT